MTLHVLRTGALTTIQDLGRTGFAHLGVSAAGAADSFSLRLANRLVGNRDDDAGLEITLSGPRLRTDADTVIAVVGGRTAVHVDDEPVATGQTVCVRAGQIIDIGTVRTGLRAYVAFAGGIRVARVLGSRSTDTLAELGPERLRRGATIPVQPTTAHPPRYLRHEPPVDAEAPVRVIPGPHAEWFTPDSLERLLAQGYRIDSASNRIGVRLKGEALERAHNRELDSEGMVTGALQVPLDGQPIALLPNHGPTGGYPAIATVISADIWRLGQARPGQWLRFQAVSLTQAHAALAEQRDQLNGHVVVGDADLLRVRELIQLSADADGVGDIEIRHAGGLLRLRR